MVGDSQTGVLRAFIETELMDRGEPPIDFDTPLVEEGILDSLNVVTLLAFVEERYGIRVDEDSFDIAVMSDLRSLSHWVDRLRAEPAR